MLVDSKKTLGSVWLQGLVPHVRCRRGRRSGPVKIEPCGYEAELDLETLIWTRGAKFPCWRLAQRLKCPDCGGLSVDLVWLPRLLPDAPGRRPLIQCVVARDGVRAR